MDIIDIEKILVENGFIKYKHKTGYEVWSKEDLFATDDMKEWFLA